MKKLKISLAVYNIIFTLLYPIVAPINFLLGTLDFGWREACWIERDNFNDLKILWKNWREWIKK